MVKVKCTTQEADEILFAMMKDSLSEEKSESDRVKIIVDDIYSLKTIIKYANLIFDNGEVDNIMITVRYDIFSEHMGEIAELFSSYYETRLTTYNTTFGAGQVASYVKILIYKKGE